MDHQVVSVLLERPGLELEAVNVRGQTAAEVAMARGHHQVGGDIYVWDMCYEACKVSIFWDHQRKHYFLRRFSFPMSQYNVLKTKPNGAWFAIVNHS